MLQRIAYDATIEDAADVSWRLASRTHAFRRQFRTHVAYAGIGSGLVFFVAWMFIVGASPLNLVLASVAATLFAIVFAAIAMRFLEKDIRRQQRTFVAEQFGDTPIIRSEVELRSDAVWVRQAGMEVVFPWTLCTGVQDNTGDVEIQFAPGICVVRNRHFASPAEREDFLDTARRLSIPATPT